jgi:hypothetical protein
MRSCPGCGLSLASDAVFCPTCGWQNAAATPQRAPAASNAAPADIRQTAPFSTGHADGRSDAGTGRKTLAYLALPAIAFIVILVGVLALHHLPLPIRGQHPSSDLVWRGTDVVFGIAIGLAIVIAITLSDWLYSPAARLFDSWTFGTGVSARRFRWVSYAFIVMAIWLASLGIRVLGL